MSISSSVSASVIISSKISKNKKGQEIKIAWKIRGNIKVKNYGKRKKIEKKKRGEIRRKEWNKIR